MTSIKVLAALVAVVIIAGGAGLYLISSDRGDIPVPDAPVSPVGPSDPGSQYVPAQGSSLDWTQWLGGIGAPGVSDAETPISKSSMVEVWRTSGTADGSSINWSTPGSAICIGELTYYYNGSDSTLRCVETSTGEIVRSVVCQSRSVYNMAICYGDGKVFVPTLVGLSTVMVAFDAETMERLFVSQPVAGGEVQGPIVYNDGRVYFGTYGGDFACFPSEDRDTGRGDEVVSPLWTVAGSGWYNASPAFMGDMCVIVDKGYDIGGAIAYLVDVRSGAILDTMVFDLEYCVSGAASYDGRVYIPLNAVTDKENASSETNTGKTLVIRSFVIDDGSFVRSSEKVWTSSTVNGGTQSIPVIWNHRLYICGGGSTMGSDEPFTVIDIGDDGTMVTAYTVPQIKSKATVSLTTAYSTESNGYSVYIYIIEYGRVNTGEAADSANGSADIYCLRDSVGQRSADIVFSMTPSVRQFAYQSFTISPDGYLLVRNDSTLFCYGVPGSGKGISGLVDDIDRLIEMSGTGDVSPADVEHVEERYSSLDDTSKAKVTNYSDLQSLYRTVTFVTGDGTSTGRFLIGSLVDPPSVSDTSDSVFVGWSIGSGDWCVYTDRVVSDITLTARFESAHTVSFDSDGGDVIGSILVADGSVMGYVPNPVREGYTFDGWYSGQIRYDPQHSTVSSDLVLRASWLKDSIISFDSDGGSAASPIQVTRDRPVGTLPTVSKGGHSFGGWYLGDVRFTDSTIYPYDNDILLKAVWTENTDVTVDTGKGVKVTGSMPEDVEVTVTEKPDIETNSKRAISKAAGGIPLEYFMVGIYGDGVDGEGSFTIDIRVSSAMEGRTLDAYCYIESAVPNVVKVSGTVTGGVLSLDMKGTTSSRGVQIEFGLVPGTGLADRV